VIDDLEKKAGKEFALLKIDAGVHTNLMRALNIEPIPLFIVYKGGKEVWRKQGVVSKEELLKQLK
jgi:thioredoxin-like negative regulator of GroEL